MTVGQWLLAGFVALLVVGCVLVVVAWWEEKNGGNSQPLKAYEGTRMNTTEMDTAILMPHPDGRLILASKTPEDEHLPPDDEGDDDDEKELEGPPPPAPPEEPKD